MAANYSATDLMKEKNGIGIVVREDLVESLSEVRRMSDKLMAMKVEIKGSILNIVSACAPKVNNSMEEKNGNIGDEEIMGRYGAGTKNKEESMVVDFAKRMDLAMVSTYFKKKHKHRVTYKSGGKSAPQIM